MTLDQYGHWTRIYLTYQAPTIVPRGNPKFWIPPRFYHTYLACVAGVLLPEEAQKQYPKANTIHYMKHGNITQKCFFRGDHWSFHET